MAFLAAVKLFLGGFFKGPLARILDTVDNRVDGEVRKAEIKGEIVKTYAEKAPDWLRAGGLVTLLIFAIPAALWRGSVYVYSILWCKVCAWPQDWAIGDIPLSFREIDVWIVLASIGALGLVARR